MNCYKIQKLELGQHLPQSLTNFKNLKCDKIKQLKLGQNSITQIVTKFKNSNYNQKNNV